jgi:hypothetical protein
MLGVIQRRKRKSREKQEIRGRQRRFRQRRKEFHRRGRTQFILFIVT